MMAEGNGDMYEWTVSGPFKLDIAQSFVLFRTTLPATSAVAVRIVVVSVQLHLSIVIATFSMVKSG